MSAITTHILDTSRGRPATGVEITLWQRRGDDHWHLLAQGTTDDDGRVSDLLPSDVAATVGTYRLRFEVGSYFCSRGEKTFYPYADIVFQVHEPTEHYHVPLLLNPFGYSTYRGS